MMDRKLDFTPHIGRWLEFVGFAVVCGGGDLAHAGEGLVDLYQHPDPVIEVALLGHKREFLAHESILRAKGSISHDHKYET